MNDVQAYIDARKIAITKVGIKGLSLPLVFKNIEDVQHTIVKAELTVNLQEERKGTHMSRFIETWQEIVKTPIFELSSVRLLLEALKSHLDADNAHCILKFPLFFKRYAPVTQVESLMNFECEVCAELAAEHYQLVLIAPVTSLCPCSKELSKDGAHSQRSHLTIMLRFKNEASFSAFNINDTLLEIEKIGSSSVYALLKRPDEKYVTEKAYDNPKFVEDIVRDLVLLLKGRRDLAAFSVESENFESIHNHQAYAKIDYNF